ncbi:MAG: hypothetical protein AAF438_16855, partial [Pseudomonadota bacterium]
TYFEKKGAHKNLVMALRGVQAERNYLAHNLHALFAGLVGESMTPRVELLESNVDLFVHRVEQLKLDLRHLASAIEETH